MEDIHEHITKLYARLAHVEGVLDRSHRHGTITDVDYSDPKKPRARMTIATNKDGKQVKGPWVPVASWAGERTIHMPVTVGQQVSQVSPGGVYELGYIMPLGFSQPIQSPSTDPNEHKDVYGKVTDLLHKEDWTKSVGESSVKLEDGTLTIKVKKVVFDSEDVLMGKNAHIEVSMKGTVDSGGYADIGPVSRILKTE